MNFDRLIATITEAIAATAEQCAASLEAGKLNLSGPDALRNFARAIRETSRDLVEQKEDPIH